MSRTEEIILGLQQENQRLKAELDRAKQEPKLTADQEYLMELVGLMKEHYGDNRVVAPDLYQEIMKVHDRIEKISVKGSEV